MKRIIALKEEALDALHGNFGKAALATLVFALIYGVIGALLNMGQENADFMDVYRAMINGDYSALLGMAGGNPINTIASMLSSLLIYVPLTVGMSNTFRLLLESKGQENKFISNIFKLGFGKKYLHIVWVMLVNTIIVTIMSFAAIIIPVIIMFAASNVLVSIICIIGILFLITVISLTYSMVSYIVLDTPGLGAIESMRRSRNLMTGNRWRLFVLELSFIGWLLLGIFTLFIGYLWLMPYMVTSEAALYCEVRDAETAA